MFPVEYSSFYLQKRHNSKCVIFVESILYINLISLETLKITQVLWRTDYEVRLVYF